MSDKLRATIRTAWPMLIGALAAWLSDLAAPVVSWAGALGVEVTEADLAVWVALAAGVVVYQAGRWLEIRRWPGLPGAVARGVGRFVMTLGLPAVQPVYLRRGDRATMSYDGTVHRS